jgi:putative hydrolase of the HAD superfamily
MHLIALSCLLSLLHACIVVSMHNTTQMANPGGHPIRISVDAVVFDYGNVLCLEQSSSDLERMARICQVPARRFSESYWGLRASYDRGDLSGAAYWSSLAAEFGQPLSGKQIPILIELDCVSVARPNEAAIRWARQLHAAGIALALLSNMPRELSQYVANTCQWLSLFDHLIFSCDHRSIKPESLIYGKCLEALRLDATRVLYFDDRAENIEAASRMGIHSVLFEGVDQAAKIVEARFDVPVPVIDDAALPRFEECVLTLNR